MEYCKRWVDMSPDDRGYRKACIAALAEATGLSPRTIGNWGANERETTQLCSAYFTNGGSSQPNQKNSLTS